MTDTQSLKANNDLLAMAERETQLRRVAGTEGGEYAGPCPFCGGRDRFRVQPARQPWGLWMCRHCTDGKWQDVIEFVQRRDNCDFKTACKTLGGPDLPTIRERRPAPVAPAPPKPSGPPNPTWQARGLAFVEECVDRLWRPEGAKALDYLHNRGLEDDTIRYYNLGYHQADIHDTFEAWGLVKDPKKPGVSLPRGIVIPYFVGGALWHVKFRRPAGEPKYIHIPTGGAGAALFGADNLIWKDIVLLTEGEFDCILADQLLFDLVGVASLGSALKGLDVASWGRYLLPARAILAAYDLDEAGRRGLEKLAKNSPQIHPARVPALRAGDKDITDYHLAGGDLREWLLYQLDRLDLAGELIPAGECRLQQAEQAAPVPDYAHIHIP